MTLYKAIGLALLVVTLIATPRALGQSSNTPITYELLGGSTFQDGCSAPCMCPVRLTTPIYGTFKLTATGLVGGYQTYAVTEVSWLVWVDDTQLRITGSGTYKRGGQILGTQQMVLDLNVGGTLEHLDSGLVSGGNTYPKLDITVSTGTLVCRNTVVHVIAQPAGNSSGLPRRAYLVVEPSASSVSFSLLAGGSTSKVAGTLQLYLGDPSVAVPALQGLVGMSVDRAVLTALDFDPDFQLPDGLVMVLDPGHRSTGSWNYLTGDMIFDLYLTTTASSGLPVPQPVHLAGTFVGGTLKVSGGNGDVPDGGMTLQLLAHEVNLPVPPADIWFSTRTGFTAGRVLPTATAVPLSISDGDLLSRRGYVVRRNRELTARLGIMPVVPDLGLDGVAVGSKGEIWFSFKKSVGQIWSEKLRCWLKHGDLLSEAGFVVQTNEQLLAKFVRMPPVADAGLDAVCLAPNGEILFSVDDGFFCESLGRVVGRGDLLSNRGRIVMTNVQLMQNFHPFVGMGPQIADYGLDAIIARSNREFWFSVETGFIDTNLGPISEGDLLSTLGYVVARNKDLLAGFTPTDSTADFGLDAATTVVGRWLGDFDMNGHVDAADLAVFTNAASGPAVISTQPEIGDLDGDGDVDMEDFGILQRCLSGAATFGDPDCGG